MLSSIKKREHLKKVNKLVSLQNQIKAVKLQDKLRKQNFHEDMKKVFATVSKAIKDSSQGVANTLTEIPKENN